MTLIRPSLEQLLWICQNLEADQLAEHSAFGFGDYNPAITAWTLYNCNGPSHVFVDDDLPYMAAGFSMFNSRSVETWAVSTPDRQGHSVTVTRTCRGAMDDLFEAGVQRIQTRCASSRTQAREWYSTLGLVLESEQKSMGKNGENLVTYVRFRGAN